MQVGEKNMKLTAGTTVAAVSLIILSAGIFQLEVVAHAADRNSVNQGAGTAALPDPASLRPRWIPGKPAKTILEPWQEPNRIIIKFAEGSNVRLRQGGLVSLKGWDLGQVSAVLARYRISPGALRRYFTRPEVVLEQEKRSGEAHSGRQLADLNLYFDLYVSDDVDVGLLCDDLNALDIVELAEPAPAPSPPPVDLSPPTPDFSGQQGFRDAAPGGIAGAGMTFVDIEYDWTLAHEDLELPPTTNIDTAATLYNPWPSDPGLAFNHGTAVLGEIAGGDNGYGVTGIAPAATAFVAPEYTVEFGSNRARAVNLAAAAVSPGDVILLEMQTVVCGGGSGEYGPAEWSQPVFDATATATANGIIVVAAAGNGAVDLDSASCNNLFDTTTRDSGAIIVGAGHPSTHEKLPFSSYGSRVDMQGWGENVTTTGYGALFDPSDVLQRYTDGFSGTSSASPIVTGAILAIQGARQAAGFAPLLPLEMRQLLKATGTPQTGTLHIGPLPDIGAALSSAIKSPTMTSPLPGALLQAGAATDVTWTTNYALPLRDDMESGAGQWSVSHGAGSLDWGLDTGNPNGGASAWFAVNPATTGDQYLASTGTLTVPDNGQLRFWHHYDVQTGFDGGVVEISTDGATWDDLGPDMTQGGYNGTINTCCTNPLAGRAAFTGNSGGYIETRIDLDSYAGQAVYIRFRLGTDETVAATGWYVDDVTLAEAPGPDLVYDLAYTDNCTADVYFTDDMETGGGSWFVSHGPGSLDWGLGTANPYSGSSAWFAADPDAITDQYLTTAALPAVPAGAQLSIRHHYDTEANYDGGVVEISTDGGTVWADLGPGMTKGSYNGTLSTCCSNPLGGRAAFTGNSGGYIETLIDLNSYAGQNVLVRFRMASDDTVAANGWFVDDVTLFADAGAWTPAGTSTAGAGTLSWAVPLTPGNDYCLGIQGRTPGNIVSAQVTTGPFEVYDGVVNSQSDGGPGSLRQVIADVPAGGIITFDPAVLDGQTITLNQSLLLDKHLGIDASGLPNGLTLNGDDSSRLFEIGSAGNVTLLGLTLTGGRADLGGAIRNSGGTLTLEDSTLQASHATNQGGAIYNLGGTVNLDGVTLSGNSAASVAGAISNTLGGVLTLTNSTVSGNTSYWNGGAILNEVSSLNLVHTTISNNSVNSAGFGGGIDNAGGTVNIENSVVAANTGPASGSGPDIGNRNGGTINPTGNNLIGDNGTVTTEFPAGAPNANGDLVGIAPLLAPLDFHGGPTMTQMPLYGSPAIDAVYSGSLDSDQRGVPRPQGGARDIGAVEVVDADGDGLGDIYEVLYTVTSPYAVDSDGDGLVDGAGGVVLTSAYPGGGGIDTNGDGFVDGELDFGTDPAVSNLGDVAPRNNPDNLIDLGDLLVLTRLVTGAITPDALEMILGDINGDTRLNAADVLLLQQAVLNGTAP